MPRSIASSDVPPPATSAPFRQIDIDLIRPNPHQPRQQLDEAALEELARSLDERGMIQPVVVRPVADGRYELVAGERRWRAAQRIGLLKIPAIIKEVPDDRMLEVALIENIQREELSPIDEARAYRTLLDDLGLTQQEVARRVGKRRSTITNLLRLLSLVPAVQRMVRSGELEMGHARALAGLENPARQQDLAERARKEGLSVREIERLVARAKSSVGPTPVAAMPKKDPNVAAAEDELQRALGTKVRITAGRRGGVLQLYYHSQDELMRLYDLVIGAARAER